MSLLEVWRSADRLCRDQLSVAGAALTKGDARRGFIHDGRLLAMSDQRLEAFDISNRAKPVSTSKVDLSRFVDSLEVAGESVIQTGRGATGRADVEVNVSSLSELVAFESGETFTVTSEGECEERRKVSEVVTSDDRGYVIFSSYSSQRGEFSRVTTLDVSNPSKPKLVGSMVLEESLYGSASGTAPDLVDNGARVIALGDALAFTLHDVARGQQGAISKNEASLEIVDLTNPAKPKRTSLALPTALGYSGLLQSGNVVATSHFEAASEDGQVVRFYLDRVDVSDVSAPVLARSVNVPGALLAYDDESQRALLLDYQYAHVSNISPRQCQYEEHGVFEGGSRSWLDYDEDRVDCTALRFTLNVVDVSSKQNPSSEKRRKELAKAGSFLLFSR